MQKRPYNKDAAVSYARKWAYSRNPTYYDFEKSEATVQILIPSVFMQVQIPDQQQVRGAICS